MRRGFTLIEIMIVVAVIATLAAIAIPNLLRARINANEAIAQATLKTYAAALETYASDHNCMYPTDNSLTNSTPPYLSASYADFWNSTKNGYTYYCLFSSNSYTCQAYPENMNITGTRNFTITTGGVMSSN